MNVKTRHTIRKKIQTMVLSISIVALATTSTIGIISMVIIQDNSESALIHQMEQNLYNITSNKAELADSELGKYADHVMEFSRFIHNLYISSSDYGRVEVLPYDIKNTGRYTMQLDIANSDVDIQSIQDELGLLGNIEKLWQSVIPANENLITTVYFGTEKGFMAAYDKGFHNDNEDEKYFNFFNSSWYIQAKSTRTLIFTDIYNDEFGRGLTITCAAPFYNAENEFAGVVAMDILISDMYNAIIKLELGENSYAFLVDNAGDLITPYDTENQQKLNIFQDNNIDPFIADEIIKGQTGISLAESEIYYAYTTIKSTGWKFCVRIPKSVILAPVDYINRNIILIISLFSAAFIIILIFVAIIARKFSGRLTAPIIDLNKDVKEISSGNLDYIAEIHDNDEIGDLAQSFNSMAVSLKEYIKNLASVTAEKERIGAELNIATQIQADMLPRKFPVQKEFELYASMTPAKEVGGDFYDFFMIDSNHIALVIADVSGKGVPAALFMVIAKTLIKTRTQMGGSPSEILNDVNNQLCEGNDADLFVTVWLGILDISTGKITAANAGHEYPAVRRLGGNYELIKSKPSPAVAAMEGMKFRENEITLYPGDNLYIYTDGVAEATNSNEELYGTGRMLEALNRTKNYSAEEILISIKRDVDEFTGEAPQFDDITMLCVKYFGGENFVKELTIEADENNLEKVLAFVNEQLEVHDCPTKAQMQINVAVEELFVNIAHYAYNPDTGPATVRVEIQEEPLAVVITFIDRGIPYDPLAKPDPDVTLSAEERQIGGLGIYMVKKSMDSISYEYKYGKNILTIKKVL